MNMQNIVEKQSSILDRAIGREAELDRIDGHRKAQTCSICRKHLDYSEGCYTITHSHYDCAFPAGYKSPSKEFEEQMVKMDAAMDAIGFKRKRQQAKIGYGGPTKKLIEIIDSSALKHFEAKSVTDIHVFLPPPVWRQFRFDVMRVEGSMKVDGRSISFGSWFGVLELIKYRQLKWDNEWPNLDMSPVYETQRTRRKTTRAKAG